MICPATQQFNVSQTSSPLSSFVDSGVPWYYAYTVKYVQPATLPLGIAVNLLSLLVLPRSSVCTLHSASLFVLVQYICTCRSTVITVYCM